MVCAIYKALLRCVTKRYYGALLKISTGFKLSTAMKTRFLNFQEEDKSELSLIASLYIKTAPINELRTGRKLIFNDDNFNDYFCVKISSGNPK